MVEHTPTIATFLMQFEPAIAERWIKGSSEADETTFRQLYVCYVDRKAIGSWLVRLPSSMRGDV